jgi:hypothetical protein
LDAIVTFVSALCGSRLLIGACWPIVLLLIVAVCRVGVELAQNCGTNGSRGLVDLLRVRAALQTGLERTLPLVLVVTFLLVPSIATKIFQSFLCDPFEFNANMTKRYLHDDLSMDCDQPEYAATVNAAVVLIFVWPVGCPVLYAVLLWMSRKTEQAGRPATALTRATAFLAGDSPSCSCGSPSKCAAS